MLMFAFTDQYIMIGNSFCCIDISCIIMASIKMTGCFKNVKFIYI